ncbi:MAG TPA: type II secretion system protein GspG [Thermoanaerobaculia bacterium]|nr:type II secretion system protein GspG [Thermoanaerobaculia bacterium]
MAFCAWCGNHVPAVSYAACPRCGNPTNGAQRVAGSGDGGGKTAGLIVGLAVGGLVLVAIIGILAAIAIPNLLTAMERSKQKRTTADLRTLATATEAYATDHNQYPKGSSASELSSVLVPTYMKTVPALDGWGTPIKYECWPAGTCESYAFASAGKDKIFERESLQEYSASTKTSNFDCDLVFSNGEFIQYPEGIQSGGSD